MYRRWTDVFKILFKIDPLNHPLNRFYNRMNKIKNIILDLTVVLNCAIDGIWINSLDDFGERFREKSVSQLL